MSSERSLGIWFERLCGRLGLPFWAGAILLGLLPVAVLFPLSYYYSGVWVDFLPSGAEIGTVFLLLIVFALLAARYIRKKLETLIDYADSLVDDGSKTSLKELYRFRGVAITYLILSSIVQPIYFFAALPQGYTPLQKVAVSTASFYWGIFLNTFFWIWVYSMYKIYKTGKRPMNLRPFTEDRTLGLKPFGRLSLQLTAIYVAFVASIFIPQSLAALPLPLSLLGISLILLGLVIFFIPLMSLHGKLLEARRQAFEWISPQYTELVLRIRKEGVKKADEEVFHEMSVIDKLQRDINQIHSWPFDATIVTRLAAVVFSVVAILLATLVRNLLHF